MKKEHWVEIKLFGSWQKAIAIKEYIDKSVLCQTGFGVIRMKKENVRNINES